MLLALLAAPLSPACAQSNFVFTEYYGTPGSEPVGITTGPDGALWFTDAHWSAIGRMTPSGAVTEYAIPVLKGASQAYGAANIRPGPQSALWFGGNNYIGKITTGGTITLVPFSASGPTELGELASGPDGALWFADAEGKVDRITTSGAISEYPLPTAGAFPWAIVAGPDGALWFTEAAQNKIGRITTAGVITEFPVPSTGTNGPQGIAVGPDNALWFTMYQDQKIGRITTSGVVTEYPIESGYDPQWIVAGADGALWFTGFGSNQLGRITTTGTVTYYTVPWQHGSPTNGLDHIVVGPDSAIWFTGEGIPFNLIYPQTAMGRFGSAMTTGQTSLTAAVVPVGAAATLGTTVQTAALLTNSGKAQANGCGIVPVTPMSASFTYQPYNQSTGALQGVPDGPVPIAAGKSQAFVMNFTPSAAFLPQTIAFSFLCDNSPPAQSVVGYNTVLLSASATAVPNIFAVPNSPSNDILVIGSATGSTSFSVKADNLWVAAPITVSANTGNADLPLTLTVCQIKTSTGKCLQPAAATVTATILNNQTLDFGVFVKAKGSIANSFAANRIFVEFSDAQGVVRGLASVSVYTK